MAQLKAGDKAPSFKLKDQRSRDVSLSDFAGKKLLLYFYPKAETPGCTKQSESVRDAAGELHGSGVAVAGISPDTPEQQSKFDRKHRLGFPLLSDPDHKVAKAYGAWGEKSMYGKTYEGIIRSSFLIDEHSRILQANYKVKPLETVPKAQAMLG